jgi:hypothetical protein
MRKLLQHQNAKRATSATMGALVANFVVAVVVYQFGVALDPNVIATGTALLAALTNIALSKYLT